MLTVCLTWSPPTDYVPGGPETMAAWAGWFESLGDRLTDRGNPVFEPAELGRRGQTVSRLNTAVAVLHAGLDGSGRLSRG